MVAGPGADAHRTSSPEAAVLLTSALDNPVVARARDITPDQARAVLVGLRCAIAGGSLLAPKATGKLFGIDADANPSAPFLARLFGVRDGYLAVEALTAEPGARRAAVMRRQVAIDGVDVLSAVAAARSGALPGKAAVMAGGTALLAVGLGLRASREG